jgi:hypothetical protein
MRVALGSKKKVKINTFELLEVLEAPEIAEIFFHTLEAVKTSHREYILELRRKKKEAMREGKKELEASNSNIISISSVRQVYIDDPQIFRFLQVLMTDKGYKEAVLAEHRDLYKDVSSTED